MNQLVVFAFALFLKAERLNGGQYLDTYNQLAFSGYTGTIKSRINGNCMYFVTTYEEY